VTVGEWRAAKAAQQKREIMGYDEFIRDVRPGSVGGSQAPNARIR
jgi:hypothetical protein